MVVGRPSDAPTRVHTCPHLTLVQWLAAFVHDVVAHPLTFITRDAKWAWRLHDWAGHVLQKHDDVPSSLSVCGERGFEAADILKAHGFSVVDCRGDDGASGVLLQGFGSHKAAEVLTAHGIAVSHSPHRPNRCTPGGSR